MARIVITALRHQSLFGLIGDAEVEFIATDRKGNILGVKKLQGVLNGVTHEIDVGGRGVHEVIANCSAGTICEWRRA